RRDEEIRDPAGREVLLTGQDEPRRTRLARAREGGRHLGGSGVAGAGAAARGERAEHDDDEAVGGWTEVRLAFGRFGVERCLVELGAEGEQVLVVVADGIVQEDRAITA